jgi:hypothetical protein
MTPHLRRERRIERAIPLPRPRRVQSECVSRHVLLWAML